MSAGWQGLAGSLGLVLLLGAAGCGYEAGLRVSEHHESVGVELFGNDSYERDLEPLLHDQITRVLRDQSDAKVVDPREARAVIRGTLKTYRRRDGIRSIDNTKLLETGVFLEVEATLFVHGSETPVRSMHSGAWVGYIVNGPENERTARDQALAHLAQEIVLDLLGPAKDD